MQNLFLMDFLSLYDRRFETSIIGGGMCLYVVITVVTIYVTKPKVIIFTMSVHYL
jgi:hypothetical protein